MEYQLIKTEQGWQFQSESGKDFFQIYWHNIYFDTQEIAQKAMEYWNTEDAQRRMVSNDKHYVYAMLQSLNPSFLKWRFKWTIDVMSDWLQVYFKHGLRYDFEQKRCYGGNGYYLQWVARDFPDMPESYENQQTSCGHNEVIKQK